MRIIGYSNAVVAFLLKKRLELNVAVGSLAICSISLESTKQKFLKLGVFIMVILYTEGKGNLKCICGGRKDPKWEIVLVVKVLWKNQRHGKALVNIQVKN